MVRTKVFVGNLSFKTREAELAQEFGSVAKVISANIITRGPRSLGYGFVELESEEDAQKAVTAMDKKEIDGRQINVEVANLRQEGEGNAQGGQQGAQGEGARGGRGGRGRGARGASRGTRGARGGRGAARGGRGGRRAFEDNNNAVATGEGEGEQARPRRTRAPKPQGEGANKPDNRVESQTSLFVANLPFSLNDETFGKVFTDAGLKFKTAHVVTKRNGRSKGFGFVEFDNHEDQQKALNTLNGNKIEERELILRVALTDEAAKAEKQEGEQQPQQEENKQ